MSSASERLLRLLALLHRGRRGADDLAAALGVTPRTVRRDVTSLRGLGFPVEVALGPGGGYRLTHDVGLPPLVFDTDEAVAALLALHLTDPSGAAASAGRKIQRALPRAQRTATAGLLTRTSRVPMGRMLGAEPGPVDPGALALLARACHEHRRVAAGERLLEPQELVQAMDRWYVVAYDVGTAAWVSAPVDELPGLRLTPDLAAQGPLADARRRVADQVEGTVRRVTGTVRVHAPAAAVRPWVQPAWGTVTEETPETTIVRCGAGSHDGMARWLLLVEAEVTVLEPPALRRAFARLARTARRAATAPAVSAGRPSTTGPPDLP